MKIRTDFVTNSSSSNYAEIVIDNPKLLKILQHYKDRGVFGDVDRSFGIRDWEDGLDCGRSNDEFKQVRQVIQTPAFFHIDVEGTATSEYPETLKDVLESIVLIMDNEIRDGREIYEEMRQELFENKEEIETAYLRVVWKCEYSWFGSEAPNLGEPFKWSFYYTPDNGEEFIAEEYQPSSISDEHEDDEEAEDE